MPYHDPNARLLPEEVQTEIKRLKKKLKGLSIETGLSKRIITHKQAEMLSEHKQGEEQRRANRREFLPESNHLPEMQNDPRKLKKIQDRRQGKPAGNWRRDLDPHQILERFESASKSRALNPREISKLRAFLVSSNPQTRQRASQAVRAIKQNRGNVRQRELRKRMQKPRKA